MKDLIINGTVILVPSQYNTEDDSVPPLVDINYPKVTLPSQTVSLYAIFGMLMDANLSQAELHHIFRFMCGGLLRESYLFIESLSSNLH